MGTRRRFPLTAVAAWLAVVADLGATTLLVLSDAPDVVRFGVPALQALGIYTIVVWYVARRP